MNQNTIAYLICPTCASEQLELKTFSFEENATNAVREGIITCLSCRNWYRVENGILDFLPLNLRRNDLQIKFAVKHNLQMPSGFQSKEETHSMMSQKIGQIDYFSEEANDYEKRVVNSPYYVALDQVAFLDWLSRHQELLLGGIAIDIGCGTGRQSIPLAKHGIKTIAIDTAEEMLMMAKSKLDSQKLSHLVDLIAADGENPPVKDNCFGACIFYGVLHHMPNKDIAIKNASKKLVKGGLFYSLDPHKSPVRFIFDFLMRVKKLYHEEASDDPLLTQQELKQWFTMAGLDGTVKLSTYLPPHLFYTLSLPLGVKLLRLSDLVFSSIPGVRKLAGVIISECKKSGEI